MLQIGFANAQETENTLIMHPKNVIIDYGKFFFRKTQIRKGRG